MNQRWGENWGMANFYKLVVNSHYPKEKDNTHCCPDKFSKRLNISIWI